MKASEGLSRLHKVINKDEDLQKALEKSRKQDNLNNKQKEIEKADSKKAEPVQPSQPKQNNIEVDLKRYEEEKVQGNNFFKDSNCVKIILWSNKSYRKL